MLTVLDTEYDDPAVFGMLQEIDQSKAILYERDVEMAEDMLRRGGKYDELTPGRHDYLGDIIFKYVPRITAGLPRILVTANDLALARRQIAKLAARGNHRYPGVQAFRGVAGERVVFEWLKDRYPALESNTPIGEGDDIDAFDFRLGSVTADIKCSTEVHYAFVTPKINVALAAPKDYYIGVKYDDRDPNNNFITVVGYMTHQEIFQSGESRKFGAQYLEVRLRKMHPLEELLSILDEQSQSLEGQN